MSPLSRQLEMPEATHPICSPGTKYLYCPMMSRSRRAFSRSRCEETYTASIPRTVILEDLKELDTQRYRKSNNITNKNTRRTQRTEAVLMVFSIQSDCVQFRNLASPQACAALLRCKSHSATAPTSSGTSVSSGIQ